MRKILMTAATLALAVGLLKLTANPVVGPSVTPANGNSALKTPWDELVHDKERLQFRVSCIRCCHPHI